MLFSNRRQSNTLSTAASKSALHFSLICISAILTASATTNCAFAFQQDYAETKARRKAEAEQLLKQKSEAFLVEWLEKHDEQNVVVDADGVGIKGNATRIKALLYGSKKSDGGYIVETEFRIKMPDGRTIIEFLAGTGETEEQAIDDTILNFILSTYHVAYKAFINADDLHQEISDVMIGGRKRRVLHGDTVTRSNIDDPLAEFDLNAELQTILKERELDGETHWLKVVYGQNAGKIIAASVTLDNKPSDDLTKAINDRNWPETKGFYLTKQFLIVLPTK